MNQPFYTFYSSNQALLFDFSSIGKNIISKAVIYTRTDIPDLYTLALVDVYNDGTFDDIVVSDNGDMVKILVTVFKTLSVFFTHYPNAAVAFSGSTPARTRLYRIAISHELDNITKVYDIWGINNNSFQPFRRNTPYTGFLISLKNINIA
ncbi:hypothetical protein FC093_16490 [Ilyomonas limi]|uniref:Uncharacterized protein n=1 Tax=Ilyomonas limi TaxID=2575867 RepID=A0A4U3KY21_9BACT|nr:hypothetical protein [Ilyomonas limi]TKK66634.1 hypothetical protein FC093_16490 [Ilyomonas limi]